MLSIESLILAKQRRRRAQAHQGADDDEPDSLKRHGTANTQGNAEKVVLVGHSLGSIFSITAIIKYPDIAEGTVASS